MRWDFTKLWKNKWLKFCVNILIAIEVNGVGIHFVGYIGFCPSWCYCGVDTRNQSVVIWIVIPLCLYMEYLGREREREEGGGGERKMFKCLDLNYQCWVEIESLFDWMKPIGGLYLSKNSLTKLLVICYLNITVLTP